MTQQEFSREISLERLQLLGKLRNSEDDLSTTIFLDKEKADKIVKNVLGDIFRENMARYTDGE